jgi:glycosyltransferase involved in cell wall biosynthesis
MKPHVVYWNNIPAPYVVEYFNALVRRANLDFEAWFCARTEPGRSWRVDESSWEFPYRYLPSMSLRGRRLSVATPLLGRRLPDLLVSLYAEPSFLLGWQVARRRGVRTAFWSMVTFDSWVRRRPWKEALKRLIFPTADGILTVDADGRRFALRYGAMDERIHYVRPGVDVGHFARRSSADAEGREASRLRLGLRGVTFIYVGRLWWGKGLDYLLDAFSTLQRWLDEPISLLLVGDGPEEANLRARCRSEDIANVVFAGFAEKERLPDLYQAADVLVFPTLGDPYGHVIDEAMASSLPVISTSAAGEIRQRVDEGVNGYIVPPRNSAALFDRMEALARNQDLREKMGIASAAKVAAQTPDHWAQEFEAAVEMILSSSRVGAR